MFPSVLKQLFEFFFIKFCFRKLCHKSWASQIRKEIGDPWLVSKVSYLKVFQKMQSDGKLSFLTETFKPGIVLFKIFLKCFENFKNFEKFRKISKKLLFLLFSDFNSLCQNGMVNAFVSFFHSFITREHDSGKLNMKLTREWTLR